MSGQGRPPMSSRQQVGGVLVSHALAAVAMSLPWPLLMLKVHEQFGDGWQLGFTGAARMLPYVALSWFIGGLADRWGRGRVVRASLVLRMGLLAITAAAISADDLGWAIVAATATIALSTPAYPALAASMPTLSGHVGGRATSALVTVEVTSFVVGPALGVLAIPLGANAIGAISVAGTALAAAALHPVHLPSPLDTRPRAAAAGASPQLRLPILGLLQHPGPVRTSFLVMALINAMLAAVGITLLPLAQAAWHSAPQAYGTALAVLGFGALAGPILRGVGRADTARMGRCLGLLGLSVMVLAAAPSAAWALPPLALAGAVAVQSESAATGILQATVPDQWRAGVLGAADTAMVGAAMLAALVTPGLVTAIGVIPLITVLGVATIGAAALLRSSPAPAYLQQSS